MGTGSQPPGRAGGRYGGRVNALTRTVEALIRGADEASVAVVARPVGGSDGVSIRPGLAFHAASTMKVPVLVELWRSADAGTCSLDEPIVVRNRFASVLDGSPYALDPADDTELTLYRRIGEAVPARELARLMIVRSSNLATNLLVDRLGAGAVDDVVHGLGVRGVRVRRGVEDEAAFTAGINSTVTAAGLARLLELLAMGAVVSSSASAEMLGVLAAQELNDGIPVGVPAGTRVAHKTGSIAALYHDAGVVFLPDRPPYVLVVLTAGLDEARDGPALVAAIAREVHAALAG
jgi:beta-lactamase class A